MEPILCCSSKSLSYHFLQTSFFLFYKQYQEISGGSNQLNHTGNSTARTTQNNTYTEIHTSETANNGSTWQQAEKNNDFVSADSPKSLEETQNIYKKEKSWSAENDMIET